MTPKEKAKELFTKFSANTIHFNETKRCTLICVNEILDTSAGELKDENIFWNIVKEEIELL